MGLSKKLGNVSSQRSLVPDSIEVEYKWSTQSYTIQDILSKFKLPCVVQCATDQCSVAWSKFQFDLRHPLLLYSEQTIQKVHARNLTNSTKEEFGPPVAIPEDYEGWFGAAPKGINLSKRHTRIEGIANTTTLRFLVCTQCPAFTRSTGPNGDIDYIPRDITPGETFKRVCIMDGDLENPDTPEIVRDNGPCLECLDEKDDDILIPLSHRAIIYEIADFYPDANHKVFKMKSIISAGNSKLPRILSVIHGERPVLDFAYTGMLRCYSIFTEETILAATLDDASPIRLELTTDSSARFKLSLNEASIKKTCEYNNAYQSCTNHGDAFLMGIKVSFSLKPEVSGMDDTDISYEIQSTSDMQEVDANSEFEIAWSSGQNTDSNRSKTKRAVTDNFILVTDNSEGKSGKGRTRSDRSSQGVSDDPTSPPADFTEQEIADLMVRRGMIQGLGASSSSDLNLSEEIETLRRTRGTKVNPIYICSDSSTQSDKEPTNEVIEPLENKKDVTTKAPENSDIVEMSLDESEFTSAVCKTASEYHEIGSDSDDYSEIEFGGVNLDDAGKKDQTVYNSQSQNDAVELNTLEECAKDENLDNDYSSIDSDDMEMVAATLPLRTEIPPRDYNTEFSPGLNETKKSTSSDTMNRKKRIDPKGMDNEMMLHKFKSETNVSKSTDKFKGSENDNKLKSSKIKLFPLKSSNKFYSKDNDNKPFSQDGDDSDGMEC